MPNGQGYELSDFENALQPLPQGWGRNPYGEAIASIESGGNYGALGPVLASGDRAYGRYQMMGSNIPRWSKEALGYELTPQQLLANPSAQDVIFHHKFGQYLDKYGDPSDAASMWFSGKPLDRGGAGATDVLGTSGSDYVRKFNAALASGNALGQPSLSSRTMEAGRRLLGLQPGTPALASLGGYSWAQPTLEPRYQTWPEQLVRLALGAPQQAMSGAYGVPGTREFQQASLPGAMAMASLGSVGAMPGLAEPEALGLFAGTLRSKTVPAEDFLNAQMLEDAGRSPMEIYQATGMSREYGGSSPSGRPLGKWTYELPDVGAGVRALDDIANAPSYRLTKDGWPSVKLGDWMDHPGGLYEAYPALKNIPVIFDSSLSSRALFNPSGGGSIRLNPNHVDLRLRNSQAVQDSLLSSTIHEVQHYIQAAEGFQGGAPSGPRVLGLLENAMARKRGEALRAGRLEDVATWDKYIGRFRDAVSKGEVDPLDVYGRAAGEVMARNAQRRLKLGGARYLAPWETEDVPRSQQLLFSSGVPVAYAGKTLEPVEGNPFETGHMPPLLPPGGQFLPPTSQVAPGDRPNPAQVPAIPPGFFKVLPSLLNPMGGP